MAKETINDVEKDHVIAARKEDRVVVLLILLLLYSFISLCLDYTFPIPKNAALKSIIAIGYWTSIFAIMFLIANRMFPRLCPELKSQIVQYERYVLLASVLLTSLILALNIKTGGGIDSPYVSFLSSFPIFCMILLFESISLGTCLKGVGIVILALILVYAVDPVLNYVVGTELTVNTEKLKQFMDSPSFISLTVSIIVITVISNLLSIYFAARK